MHSAEYVQEQKASLAGAVARADAAAIASDIFLAFANAESVVGDDILNNALATFKALPPALRDAVADDLEQQLAGPVTGMVDEEKQQPMRTKDPETVFNLNASSSNRAGIFGLLRVLRALAEVKGENSAPFVKAIVAQTQSLQPSDPLLYMHCTEAFLRAAHGDPVAKANPADTRELMDKLIAEGDKSATSMPQPRGPQP